MATTPEALELGRALTGEELPLASRDVAGIVAELAVLGYPRELLQEIREQRRCAHQPYPFPTDVATVRAIGFARFQALLAEALRHLTLTCPVVAPAPDRPLNPDERRLAADRPPHWG